MKTNLTLKQLTEANVKTINEIEGMMEKKRGKGEWVSDLIASRIGSWAFILTQSLIGAIWITANVLMVRHRWDPYPFILLNLVLSVQAAFAGPIIMMSQNRQNRISERRHDLDLQINLLAEQENTEMLRLLRAICERLEIKDVNNSAGAALTENTEAAALARQIDEAKKANK